MSYHVLFLGFRLEQAIYRQKDFAMLIHTLGGQRSHHPSCGACSKSHVPILNHLDFTLADTPTRRRRIPEQKSGSNPVTLYNDAKWSLWPLIINAMNNIAYIKHLQLQLKWKWRLRTTSVVENYSCPIPQVIWGTQEQPCELRQKTIPLQRLDLSWM